MAERCCLSMLVLLLLSVMMSLASGDDDGRKMIIGCYFTNWSQYRRMAVGKFLPRDINGTLCTHIHYDYANIDTATNDLKTVEYTEPGYYNQVISLKSIYPDLKILLTVGGAGVPQSSWLVIGQSTTSLQTFSENAVKFVRQYNFDGLDFDWKNAPSNESYIQVVQALRTAINQEVLTGDRQRLLLSASVAATKEGSLFSARHCSAMSICRLADYVTVTSYNFYGSWSKTLGHHSPLYPGKSAPPDSFTSQHEVVELYLAAGLPIHKLVLGMAAFGHVQKMTSADLHTPGDPANTFLPVVKGPVTVIPGVYAFYEYCKKVEDDGWAEVWLTYEGVPYIYGTETVDGMPDQLVWISIDNVRSFIEKAEYVAGRGLGGVMLWSLDMDDFTGTSCGQGQYPLLSALYSVLSNPDAVCRYLTWGPNCSETCGACSGPRPCDKVTGHCPNLCLPGWSGLRCDQACMNGTFGQNCSQKCQGHCKGGQPCDTTGKCTEGCQDGWTNYPACEQACSDGTYGPNCSHVCSNQCKGGQPCDKVSGDCTEGCSPGWTGPRCDRACSEGTYGPNCSHVCTKYCKGGQPCDKVSGNCTEGCSPGWIGSHCDRACSGGTYGPNCTQVCSNHCKGGQPCDKVSGECAEGCNPGWTGSRCDQACSDGTYGPNCHHVCSIHCEGGQLCDKVSGECTEGCSPGWTGSRCDRACRDANCTQICAGRCKGGQPCNSDTGECTEGCQIGWTSPPVCDRECHDGTYGTNCSHLCSGHCEGGQPCDKVTGECTEGCGPGWLGNRCDRECPDGTFGLGCMQTCSEHCKGGLPCNKQSGECTEGCQAGWTGAPDCHQPCRNGTFGPNCSHVCSDYCKGGQLCDRVTGNCTGGCKPGWMGTHCDQGPHQKGSNILVPAIAAAAAVGFIFLVILIIAICWRRGKHRKALEENERRSSTEVGTRYNTYTFNSDSEDKYDARLYPRPSVDTPSPSNEINVHL